MKSNSLRISNGQNMATQRRTHDDDDDDDKDHNDDSDNDRRLSTPYIGFWMGMRNFLRNLIDSAAGMFRNFIFRLVLPAETRCRLALPEYKGDTDPNVHISVFEEVIRRFALNLTQVSKAELFIKTLKDNAMYWSAGLPPDSITRYNYLKDIFRDHFNHHTYQVCQTGCRRIHPYSAEYYQKSPFRDYFFTEAEGKNPNVVLPRVLLKYNGNVDPKTHISMFDEYVRPYYLADATKAILFVSTFDDNVMHWFGKMWSGSICTYNYFRAKFVKSWDAWDGWEVGSKSPFSDGLLEVKGEMDFVLPPGLLKYKGDRDPKAHIAMFEEEVSPYELSDAVMAKVFVMTLDDNVMRWFARLRPSSIRCYGDLRVKFERDWS